MVDAATGANMTRSRPAADGVLADLRLVPIIRWNDWAYCKIAMVIACLCHALLSRPSIDFAVVGEATVLFVMFCCYAAFGYAVNSFSDASADEIAGKPNPFSEMSREQAGVVITAISAVAILAGVVAVARYWRADIGVLVGAAYLVAAAYSLAPVRLKERGFLGVAASVLAQHTIPAVIVFTAAGTWDFASVALCALSTLIGARYILLHQCVDEQADIAAGIRTVATARGAAAVRRAIKSLVFPLEQTALGAVVVLLAYAYPAVLVAAAAFAVPRALHAWFGDRAQAMPDPYSYATFTGFYYLYLPVVLAAYVSMRDTSLWPVLAFVLLWTAPRLAIELDVLARINRVFKRRRKAGRESRKRARSQRVRP